MEQFTDTLQNYMQKNMDLQEGNMSKALVALNTEAASLPIPKLKNVSRLRTEHQVYELPDSHPLLAGMDRRERDDPSPYLLAIWTPAQREEISEANQGMLAQFLWSNFAISIGADINRGLELIQDVACGGNMKQTLKYLTKYERRNEECRVQGY